MTCRLAGNTETGCHRISQNMVLPVMPGKILLQGMIEPILWQSLVLNKDRGSHFQQEMCCCLYQSHSVPLLFQIPPHTHSNATAIVLCAKCYHSITSKALNKQFWNLEIYIPGLKFIMFSISLRYPAIMSKGVSLYVSSPPGIKAINVFNASIPHSVPELLFLLGSIVASPINLYKQF